MKYILLLTLTCGILLGCQTQNKMPPSTTVAPAIAGSDRDAHGCIGSAGYLWCTKLNQCVRPWELAPQPGINKSEDSFKSLCELKTSN